MATQSAAAVGVAPTGVGAFPAVARAGGPGLFGPAVQPGTGPVPAGLPFQTSVAGQRTVIDVTPFTAATSWADALRMYLDTLAQPPQWNVWQGVAHGLTRFYEEEFDGMGRADVSAAISSRYHELMPLVFGPS